MGRMLAYRVPHPPPHTLASAIGGDSGAGWGWGEHWARGRAGGGTGLIGELEGSLAGSRSRATVESLSARAMPLDRSSGEGTRGDWERNLGATHDHSMHRIMRAQQARGGPGIRRHTRAFERVAGEGGMLAYRAECATASVSVSARITGGWRLGPRRTEGRLRRSRIDLEGGGSKGRGGVGQGGQVRGRGSNAEIAAEKILAAAAGPGFSIRRRVEVGNLVVEMSLNGYAAVHD